MLRRLRVKPHQAFSAKETSMKSRSLLALAVAGAFACGGAFAGPHHNSTEVLTPSSVNESAPWLANQPHSAGWTTHGSHVAMGVQQGQHTDGPVGTSSAASGAGT